jgi:hypothetical protein
LRCAAQLLRRGQLAYVHIPIVPRRGTRGEIGPVT